MKEIEIWKDVPAYEEYYQVSNLGNVKSKRQNKLLNLTPVRRYIRVKLYNKHKNRTFGVHQLVAMAFLNHIPYGFETIVDHIDHNPSNNKLTNLQLLSNRDNVTRGILHSVKLTSKYPGIYFVKKDSVWRAVIRINGPNICLGRFKEELKAAEMYRLALENIDKYKGDNKEFKNYLKSLI